MPFTVCAASLGEDDKAMETAIVNAVLGAEGLCDPKTARDI